MLRLYYRFMPALTFLILLAACLPTPAAPAPTDALPTATTPVDTPAAPTADASRYVNEEGQFSLTLPDGWSAHGPLAVNGDPERPYNLYILGVDPASSGGPGQSKIAILDPQAWTPEAFALSQCTTCPAQPFEDTLLGDQPARRTQVGGDGVPFMVTWYFVEYNGKLIALDLHDPETMEPLEGVIQSIRFE
jgi:hypothetical protein